MVTSRSHFISVTHLQFDAHNVGQHFTMKIKAVEGSDQIYIVVVAANRSMVRERLLTNRLKMLRLLESVANLKKDLQS